MKSSAKVSLSLIPFTCLQAFLYFTFKGRYTMGGGGKKSSQKDYY
jgi:hypothetical protein